MARSTRSNEKVLDAFCAALHYEPVVFNSIDKFGVPVYHTNVLLAIGNAYAAICTDAIASKDRQAVTDSLESAGKRIIAISTGQMMAFCGNLLEVEDSQGHPVILASETAVAALQPDQKRSLEYFGDLFPVHIPTIEQTGGGGIRCMIAENFLPGKNENIIIVRVMGPELAESCFDLRWKVLREPWDQPRGSEKDEKESQSDLLAAMFPDGRVIGTGRVQMLADKVAQVRYMAVDPDARGKGVGKELLKRLEKYALSNGASKVMLQARENAVHFYESNGYKIVEKTFLLYDEIQHYRMEKDLKL
jgi:N-acetylglutamate synthase-like GNAT family acetyltransferase